MKVLLQDNHALPKILPRKRTKSFPLLLPNLLELESAIFVCINCTLIQKSSDGPPPHSIYRDSPSPVRQYGDLPVVELDGDVLRRVLLHVQHQLVL